MIRVLLSIVSLATWSFMCVGETFTTCTSMNVTVGETVTIPCKFPPFKDNQLLSVEFYPLDNGPTQHPVDDCKRTQYPGTLCTVKNNPRMTYGPSPSGDYVLTITNFTEDDAGDYQCKLDLFFAQPCFLRIEGHEERTSTPGDGSGEERTSTPGDGSGEEKDEDDGHTLAAAEIDGIAAVAAVVVIGIIVAVVAICVCKRKKLLCFRGASSGSSEDSSIEMEDLHSVNGDGGIDRRSPRISKRPSMKWIQKGHVNKRKRAIEENTQREKDERPGRTPAKKPSGAGVLDVIEEHDTDLPQTLSAGAATEYANREEGKGTAAESPKEDILTTTKPETQPAGYNDEDDDNDKSFATHTAEVVNSSGQPLLSADETDQSDDLAGVADISKGPEDNEGEKSTRQSLLDPEDSLDV